MKARSIAFVLHGLFTLTLTGCFEFGIVRNQPSGAVSDSEVSASQPQPPTDFPSFPPTPSEIPTMVAPPPVSTFPTPTSTPTVAPSSTASPTPKVTYVYPSATPTATATATATMKVLPSATPSPTPAPTSPYATPYPDGPIVSGSLLWDPQQKYRAAYTLNGSAWTCYSNGTDLTQANLIKPPAGLLALSPCIGSPQPSPNAAGSGPAYFLSQGGFTDAQRDATSGASWGIDVVGAGNGVPLQFNFRNHSAKAANVCASSSPIHEVGLNLQQMGGAWEVFRSRPDGRWLQLKDTPGLAVSFQARLTSVPTAPPICTSWPVSVIRADLRLRFPATGSVNPPSTRGSTPDLQLGILLYEAQPSFRPNNDNDPAVYSATCQADGSLCWVVLRGSALGLPALSTINNDYTIDLRTLLNRYGSFFSKYVPPGMTLDDATIYGFDIYSSTWGSDLDFTLSKTDITAWPGPSNPANPPLTLLPGQEGQAPVDGLAAVNTDSSHLDKQLLIATAPDGSVYAKEHSGLLGSEAWTSYVQIAGAGSAMAGRSPSVTSVPGATSVFFLSPAGKVLAINRNPNWTAPFGLPDANSAYKATALGVGYNQANRTWLLVTTDSLGQLSLKASYYDAKGNFQWTDFRQVFDAVAIGEPAVVATPSGFVVLYVGTSGVLKAFAAAGTGAQVEPPYSVGSKQIASVNGVYEPTIGKVRVVVASAGTLYSAAYDPNRYSLGWTAYDVLHLDALGASKRPAVVLGSHSRTELYVPDASKLPRIGTEY